MVPTSANFVLIRCRAMPAREVFHRLYEEHGILIRDVSAGRELSQCLRISIGTEDDMEAVLAALEEILAPRSEARDKARGRGSADHQETDLFVRVALDGRGEAVVKTGIGFFDHMLEALARHGLFDLTVEAQGDLHVDGHHTVEDTGIAIGTAIARALSERAGIRRFGDAMVPLDDALVRAVVDVRAGRSSTTTSRSPNGRCWETTTSS